MKASNSFTSSFKLSLTKRLTTYLIILVLILYSADWLFTNFVIPRNSVTNYARIDRLIYKDLPDEIPVFGSSTVLRGVLAEELGPDFYNYGITATNFQKLEPLLRIELAKDKNGLIIIEMPPQFFYARPQPNIRLEDWLPFNRNPTINEFLNQYNFQKPWHKLPGSRYFGHYKTYIISSLNLSPPDDVIFSQGGKHVKRKTDTDVFEGFVQRRKEKPLPFIADPELVERFEQLVSSTDRPVFLLVAPFHKTVYETGFSLAPYKKLINELTVKHKNLSGMIVDGTQYTDEYFLDTSHLNYPGAKRLTKALKETLLEQNFIRPSDK